MTAILWICLAAIAYAWAGYPAILWLLARREARERSEADHLPPVTVVLTVHNEEAHVERRVRNLLDLDYPQDRLDVLVASDGSTDRTDAIVRSLAEADPRVSFVRTDGGGKSAAQNVAVPRARGEIAVLTDAGTMFDAQTVRALVRPFADARVGCTSGRMVPGGPDNAVSRGQGIYWRYEMFLRRLESRAGLMHTASGLAMAFRKRLFRPLDPAYGDDCQIPLDIAAQGYGVVHVEDALAFDEFPSSPEGELRSRVRMTLRNVTCTAGSLRGIGGSPTLVFAVVSHKMLRWLTPFFMLGLFVASVSTAGLGPVYTAFLAVQIAFYGLGIFGWAADRAGLRVPGASHTFSFLLANLGFLLGVLSALGGSRVTRYRSG